MFFSSTEYCLTANFCDFSAASRDSHFNAPLAQEPELYGMISDLLARLQLCSPRCLAATGDSVQYRFA